MSEASQTDRIEALLLRQQTATTEVRRDLHKLGAAVADLKAELSGLLVVDAKLDEVIRAQERQGAFNDSLSQHYAGLRSLANSGYDIGAAVSRRMRRLFEKLVEAGVIPGDALSDPPEEVGGHAASAEDRYR